MYRFSSSSEENYYAALPLGMSVHTHTKPPFPSTGGGGGRRETRGTSDCYQRKHIPHKHQQGSIFRIVLFLPAATVCLVLITVTLLWLMRLLMGLDGRGWNLPNDNKKGNKKRESLSRKYQKVKEQ